MNVFKKIGIAITSLIALLALSSCQYLLEDASASDSLFSSESTMRNSITADNESEEASSKEEKDSFIEESAADSSISGEESSEESASDSASYNGGNLVDNGVELPDVTLP